VSQLRVRCVAEANNRDVLRDSITRLAQPACGTGVQGHDGFRFLLRHPVEKCRSIFGRRLERKDLRAFAGDVSNLEKRGAEATRVIIRRVTVDEQGRTDATIAGGEAFAQSDLDGGEDVGVDHVIGRTPKALAAVHAREERPVEVAKELRSVDGRNQDAANAALDEHAAKSAGIGVSAKVETGRDVTQIGRALGDGIEIGAQNARRGGLRVEQAGEGEARCTFGATPACGGDDGQAGVGAVAEPLCDFLNRLTCRGREAGVVAQRDRDRGFGIACLAGDVGKCGAHRERDRPSL